jgi:hypothetical protein
MQLDAARHAVHIHTGHALRPSELSGSTRVPVVAFRLRPPSVARAASAVVAYTATARSGSANPLFGSGPMRSENGPAITGLRSGDSLLTGTGQAGFRSDEAG